MDLRAFLHRSLKSQWRDYRKDFARCRKKFSEKAVHQFRIGSRRLLSTMTVLAAVVPERHLKAANRALKKRLRIFARLRDTHVQLLAVKELVREFPDLEGFRRHLAGQEERLTRRVARKLKRTGLRGVSAAVDSVRKQLGRTCRDPRQQLGLVMTALGASFDQVAARLRAVNSTNSATIHRTRIAFKKFRYMTEALQSILPGATNRMIERMRAYQAHLGEIQDASVLRASLDKYLAKHGRRPANATAVRAALAQREATLIGVFLRGADELFTFAPPAHPSSVQTQRAQTKNNP